MKKYEVKSVNGDFWICLKDKKAQKAFGKASVAFCWNYDIAQIICEALNKRNKNVRSASSS